MPLFYWRTPVRHEFLTLYNKRLDSLRKEGVIEMSGRAKAARNRKRAAPKEESA